jgi:pimeloyl-ACP methyl ester carboxylesterase
VADGLQVAGGSGGVSARVEDLRTTADIAERVADHLGDVARQLGQLAVSPEVLATAPLSPVTAARAQAQATTATARLATSFALVRGGAAQLRVTATAVEAADRAFTIGSEVGTTGVGLFALGGGIVQTVLTLPQHTGTHLGRSLRDAVRAGADGGWGAFLTALRDVPGATASGTLGDVGAYWTDVVLDRPEVVNGFVNGATAVGSILTGRQLDFPAMVRSITGLGERFGLLDDRRAVEVLPADLTGASLSTRRNIRVPTSIEDLVRNQTSLMDLADLDHDSSRLRVIEVPSAEGSSWIVQVPGTQAIDGGTNPSDMATNLYLSGHRDAALLDAISAVLRDHGVGDDPVMLVGHSQGGIAAANFADRGRAEGFNVTHVVTIGSPIATVPVSRDVQLLALEHTNDVVPRLDGRSNPDRPNVTTVTRHPGGSGAYDSPIGPHGSSEYWETARLVDRSDDPSVNSFLGSASPFLAGEPRTGQDAIRSGLITDHTIRRESP